MISRAIKNSNENSTELVLNEFQLTELEERLEMVAVHGQLEQIYCCQCVGRPTCG
jgi:hypothetical protein